MTKNFQDQISEWQAVNVDNLGRYIGIPLKYFPYERGEYIPIDARYSAMCTWRYLTGNNPANPIINDYPGISQSVNR